MEEETDKKTIYITQKNIEQYEPAKNAKLKSDVPEEQSVPAPLVAPVVLFSLQAQWKFMEAIVTYDITDPLLTVVASIYI